LIKRCKENEDINLANTSENVGFLAGGTIISILLIAFYIVSYWMIFKKAEQPGWTAIVPFYNLYVVNKVAKVHQIWTVIA